MDRSQLTIDRRTDDETTTIGFAAPAVCGGVGGGGMHGSGWYDGRDGRAGIWGTILVSAFMIDSVTSF